MNGWTGPRSFARFEAKAELFNQFDERCRKIVYALFGNIETLPDRTILVGEDQPTSRLYMLCEGWAAREAITVDGGASITELFVAGDLFPVRAAMSDVTSGDRIVALSDCIVATCKASELDRAAIEHVNFARMLWWMAQRDIAILRTWVTQIGQQAAYRRVAHLFCELQVRLNQTGHSADGGFAFPITQQKLGSLVGLTPVHISRVLQRLRAEGLVEFRRGEVMLHDLEGLRHVAGFDACYLAP